MPSSVIRSFEYRGESGELQITFTTGRCYAYTEVPTEVAEAFRLALSKGRFFNLRIRDHYDYRELD